jgi:CheY-like chemotaxis protein
MGTGSELDILLVEDSSDDVFFFERSLRKSGVAARLQIAEDGARAIKLLGNGSRWGEHDLPDIVFLDLKMPNVNGFEVLDWIRRQAFAASLPVFILTSSEEPRDRDRARQLGARSYLIKPLRPEELRDVLSDLKVMKA